MEIWKDTLVRFTNDEPIESLSFFKDYEEEREEAMSGGYQEPFEDNPILEEFATNLNKKALAGEFDGLVFI